MLVSRGGHRDITLIGPATLTLRPNLLTSNKMGDQNLSRTIHLPSLVVICLLVFVLQCTHIHTHPRGADLRWSRGHLPSESFVAPRFKSYLTVLTWFLRSQNAPESKFSGAPPRTPLRELKRSPRPPNWWGRGLVAPAKNPTLALGPSGLVSCSTD